VSTQDLRIADIRTDGGTQPRAELDPDTVAEYVEAMKGGAEFPAVVVFSDGETYWLVDGFHRVDAAKATGRETIPADVREGTRRDAVLYSVGANATHGLRRTNADKWRAVVTLLGDEEWRQWSDNEIARRCAVSQPYVSKLRDQLGLSYNGYKIARRKGAEYEIDTAKIGTAPRRESRSARFDDLPLPAHPLTEMIPLMAHQTVPGLAESIRTHGLLNPIVMHKGLILDGRLRYLACIEAGVIPQFREYEGDDSDEALWSYLVSVNLIRQSFTETQLAFISLDLADAMQYENEHGTLDGWKPRHARIEPATEPTETETQEGGAA